MSASVSSYVPVDVVSEVEIMLGVRVGHQGAGGHVAAGEHLTVKQDRRYSLTYEQVSYVLLTDLQGGVSDDLEGRHIVGVWRDWGRGVVA